MNTHKPLAGVYVLDLSRFAPGGFCSLLLADLGADVVKVEAPNTGDGLRGMYGSGFDAAHIALNRGKRSIALDLRHHDAPRVLEKLVAQSAIVIDSHRPGQLDRFGLGYGAMAQANPPVVWCSITGFGDFGPNAQHPGHDLTYLGYGGLLSKLSDRDPTPPGTVVSIPLAATMASTGILAALHAAERTGQGTHLDVSMTDSAMWVRSEDIARAANAPGPTWGTSATRNVYRCADGRHVTVTATEPKSWANLCDALGDPTLAGQRVGGNDDSQLRARLETLFSTKTSVEWLATPGLGGGVGPVNDAADLLEDPHVTQRGSMISLDGTDLRVLANPIRFDRSTGDLSSNATNPPPGLGAHTKAVLREAGFTDDQVRQLHESGVVA